MTEGQVQSFVDSLDPLDKLKIYMHYRIVMSSLKYDFVVVDITENNWQHGRGPADKVVGNTAWYYLWKNKETQSFEDFSSPGNVKITDNGNQWKENGYAQRARKDLLGIYDWYVKFKHEIKL